MSPNCTLFCAAYLLGVSDDSLVAEIGHDGSEVLWPEYTDQRKTKGFSLPEIQTCFWMRNKMLAPIFVYPMLAPGDDAKVMHLWSQDYAVERCKAMTAGRKAILIGQLPSGIRHAIVYDESVYIDCRIGSATKDIPTDFAVQEIYLVCKL